MISHEPPSRFSALVEDKIDDLMQRLVSMDACLQSYVSVGLLAVERSGYELYEGWSDVQEGVSGVHSHFYSTNSGNGKVVKLLPSL